MPESRLQRTREAYRPQSGWRPFDEVHCVAVHAIDCAVPNEACSCGADARTGLTTPILAEPEGERRGAR